MTMPASHPISRLSALGTSLCCALVLAAAAPAALADGRPYLVPLSLARAAAPIQLTGGRFEPNQALTLLVRAQGGTEVANGAVADGKGALAHEISVPAAGTYFLRITDSSGRVLARMQFVAVP
jgi:hypothetical protein